MITRRLDWQVRFVEFLTESQQEDIRLDWENHDCCSWPCAGVEAMTGVDLYEPFRGKFTSATGALREIRRQGFKDLEEICRSHFEEVPLAFARRGDLILAPAHSASDLTAQESDVSPEEMGMPYALALADPPFYWALNEQGLGRAAILTAHKAFRVGE